MAEAVGICKNKPEECKKQLGALEKQLDGQIKARQKGDSWQQAHLANATALVNLHIRNDILGDVTEDDAIEHMKGDVCQMQIVESVWSLHDFIASKKRACFAARVAKLKGDVTRCFEGVDKVTLLNRAKMLEDHFAKNEEAEFDADFDALIKVILDLSIATHESPNVAPPAEFSGLRIKSKAATILLGPDVKLGRVGEQKLSLQADVSVTGRFSAPTIHIGDIPLEDYINMLVDARLKLADSKSKK